jgi:type III secretion protein C
VAFFFAGVYLKRLVRYLVLLLVVSSIFAAEGNPNRMSGSEGNPGYTINFNNVSIIEFLKFVGKIGDLNFIYQEEELDFNVTIVSEEQTSLTNVLAALVQVLRINGYTLIEDGPNLLIHRSKGANELATVVSPELPVHGDTPPPIVTRVFRIENGNVTDIARILRPLMSEGSVLEASEESRHLILTDISANIDRVSDLLLSLDSEGSPLDIDAYTAKRVPVKEIVELATQILTPVSEGNPLILVPQESTQTVYIVSTPFLANKALSVCEDLDSNATTAAQSLSGNNILLYKLKNQNYELVDQAIKQITDNLKDVGMYEEPLFTALQSRRYVSATNSLLFTGSPEALKKIDELLVTLDSDGGSTGGGGNFYIYKIRNANEEQIAKSLNNLAENLEDSGFPNQPLVEAIDSMRWIKESHSLVFTGNAEALKKLQEILPTFDVSPGESQAGLNQKPVSSDFFLYTPKHMDGQAVIESLQGIVADLKASGLSDPGFISALESAKWTPATDSILFTGSPASLEKVHNLIQSIDVSGAGGPAKEDVYIYKPEFIKSAQLQKALGGLAMSLPVDNPLKKVIDGMRISKEAQTLVFNGPKNVLDELKDILPAFDNVKQAEINRSQNRSYAVIGLTNIAGDVAITDLNRVVKNMESTDFDNKGLMQAIDDIEWIKATNSLYVTGTPNEIERVRELVAQFDVPRQGSALTTASKFFVYKPVAISAVELVDIVQAMGDDLSNSGLNNPGLINTIASAKAAPNNTVLFTGTPESIAEVQELLKTIDSGSVGMMGRTSFVVFKLKYVTGRQILSYLHGIANDLEKSGNGDSNFIAAIKSARYIPDTKSIVFTGVPKALEKVEHLCEKYDEAGSAEGMIDRPSPGGFVVFHPKYLPGPELLSVMQDFAANLSQSGVEDIELVDTIDNLKWMKKTNSILISGAPDAVTRTEELLVRFDVSGMSGKEGTDSMIDTIDDISFLIYKLQYHQGAELESALRKIAVDLQRAKGKTAAPLINAIQAVQWLEVTNSLISTGPPQTLTKLRELIHSIDIPLKQVFIEILVIDTDVSNTLNLGLRWMSQGKYREKLGWAGGASPLYEGNAGDPFVDFNKEFASIDSSNTPIGTEIPIGTGFSLGVIGDIIFHKGNSYAALGSLIDALRVEGDITIVLNQKMITQDGKQSTLFVGQNIPFQGSVVRNNTTQGGTITTSNIEYRDVGVNLTITPRVGDDGMISMSIDQEITQVENTGQDSNSTSQINVTGIQTSKTNTQTQVTMPDNHFLVLSGSVTDTKTRTRDSIPCLGGLPLIGAAFTKNDTLTEKKNVIIFVKPQIIENFNAYKEITEAQEDLFRENANEEDFDEGLNFVKDSGNESDFDF